MSQALTTTGKRDLMTMMQTDSFKQKVAASLPKHCKPDRFVRIALTAIIRTPKLAQCSEESVLQCCYQLSALGLEPDGRRAHLIPYGDKCTLIVDYKGLVELIRNSKEVSYIAADVVCEGDDFDYMKGTGAFLKHKPNMKERGKPICVYSFVKLRDGSEDFDIMNVDDVEKVRARSRSGQSGPWVTDWNEMAKKTVFRRHSKWLPFSPEIRDAIHVDDEPLTEQERFQTATRLVELAPMPEQAEQPKALPAVEGASKTPQDELSYFVIQGGYTFDQFRAWAKESGNIANADDLGSFEEIKAEDAKRFLRAKTGLKNGLEAAKGAGK